MKFPNKKVLKCLRPSKDVGIGLLRPATLHQVITEVVDRGLLRPGTLPIIIVEDMLTEIDLGYKRPTNILIAVGEQELMLKLQVDTGLIPATIPHITIVTMVYFCLH